MSDDLRNPDLPAVALDASPAGESSKRAAVGALTHVPESSSYTTSELLESLMRVNAYLGEQLLEDKRQIEFLERRVKALKELVKPIDGVRAEVEGER